MLSRVAERVYWLGRYVERAENTARLVYVYWHLMLDVPVHVQPGWATLVDIVGSQASFAQRGVPADERHVVRFLLADRANPGSVLSSLGMARENARTTREILPLEAWEHVNDVYLSARERAPTGVGRRGRQPFLQSVIAACQSFTGIITGCMSHDDAYNFIRIGRDLERADMTTRLLDVGAGALELRPPADEDDDPYASVLWMSVLRSLSAYQVYRQHVRDRVNAEDVVAYLLQDDRFPRAVAYCLGDLEARLRQLPRHEEAVRAVAQSKRRVQDAHIAPLLDHGLHEFIDELQLGFANVHERVAATWFLPGPSPAGGTTGS